MPNACISGTGSYVPPRVVTNDDLVTQCGIDTSDDWIRKRTGIRERRYAEEGVSSSDLAVPASEEAIRRAGLEPKDIEMIILATLSPDHHFPGAGVYLQEKLGLCEGDDARFVPAMDVRNQCTGFLYGLATASSMIQAGALRHVLLVGTEVHSAAIDFSTRGRTVTSLFGDGAGAVVVSATEEDRGVRGWKLAADGRFADALSLKIWDISRRPYIPLNEDGVGQNHPDMMYPKMDGMLVFRTAVRRMVEVLLQVTSEQSISVEDIDLFVFHQANLRINEHVQKQLGAPDHKFVSNIERYGNTTAATLPILLAEAERDGQLERGMKVAMVAFGSGFTWGCALVDW
jgi:3-oxoacyl-[acyl-carrier-protein] synthase-3